jgi:hypothetical protein
MKRNLPLLLLGVLLLGPIRVEAGDDMLLYWRFDSPYRFGYVEPDEVTELYGEWRDKKGTVYKLNFRCQGKDPAFRMLLYDYMDGDPLPKVRAENGEFIITVGEQIDRVRITAQHEAISRLEIERRWE